MQNVLLFYLTRVNLGGAKAVAPYETTTNMALNGGYVSIAEDRTVALTPRGQQIMRTMELAVLNVEKSEGRAASPVSHAADAISACDQGIARCDEMLAETDVTPQAKLALVIDKARFDDARTKLYEIIRD